MDFVRWNSLFLGIDVCRTYYDGVSLLLLLMLIETYIPRLIFYSIAEPIEMRNHIVKCIYPTIHHWTFHSSNPIKSFENSLIIMWTRMEAIDNNQ